MPTLLTHPDIQKSPGYYLTHSWLVWCIYAVCLQATVCKATDSLAVAIVQDFDGTDGTPYELIQQLNSPPAVLQKGVSGQHLRLTHSSSFQVSVITFNPVISGTYDRLVADFHFRITPGVRADGFSFFLLNTDQFGPSGPPPVFYSEEPNLTASFGIGFDIHYNNRVEYNPQIIADTTRFTDPNNNHISLHFNGQTLAQIPIDQKEFDIANGIFNHYQIELVRVDNGTEVTVRAVADQPPFLIDFTPIANYHIRGFHLYDARIGFSARVGSASSFHDLDNVEVRLFEALP